jgi:hypothetical protein
VNPYANVIEKVQFLAVETEPYNVQIIGEELRAKQREAALAEEQTGLITEVQSLRDELYALRQAITGQSGVVVPTPATVAPIPTAPPPVSTAATTPPVPAAATPVAVSPIKLSPWAVGLLADRCASCHNPNKSSAGFILFDKDLKTPILSGGKLILIDQVIYSNEMPLAPKVKLTPEEYNKLRAEFDLATEHIRVVARKCDK